MFDDHLHERMETSRREFLNRLDKPQLKRLIADCRRINGRWARLSTNTLIRWLFNTTFHKKSIPTNPSPVFCRWAIRSGCPHALKELHDQSKEECLFAVGMDGLMLEFVRDQDEDICLVAVTHTGLALQFVKHQTEAIQWAAINQNAEALRYAENPSIELQNAAIDLSGLVLRHIKNPTPDQCLRAVKRSGLALADVDKNKQTPELCEVAVRQHGMAIKFVAEPTAELERIAAVNGGIEFVHQTKELCQMAIWHNPYSLRHVSPKFQTEKLCRLAMERAAAKRYILRYITSEPLREKLAAEFNLLHVLEEFRFTAQHNTKACARYRQSEAK